MDILKATNIDICGSKSCDFNGVCKVIGDEAKCVCDIVCTREYRPVCGTDNVTYGNRCEMKRAGCELKKVIEVKYEGECGTFIHNCDESYLFPLYPTLKDFIFLFHS